MLSAKGYTLVICEKPDAARRVSEALSDGAATSHSLEGTTVFRFSRGKEDFVVCSAQGHVFGVSDPADERSVYPVFDVEWYPADSIDPEEKGAAKRISAVRKLSAGAKLFVNACDLDVEGETIGFNVLRYACENKERGAKRARFSTLTKEELARAFDEAGPQPDQGLAKAGRARHVIDFVWGVNLSRILSQSAQAPGIRYRTVSIGRVQGPTLGFLVEKEKEIRTFVPVPTWRVSAEFDAGGRKLWAEYVKSPLDTELSAKQVAGECDGKSGVVKALDRRSLQVGPPVPFNIGALQKEAYRVFGFPPNKTMRVAESLYLAALISYPRTGSQRLPPSIGYEGILRKVGQMPEYSKLVGELPAHDLRPVQGPQEDRAHPAIHPTGEKPRRTMGKAEHDLFDLVVRRFLAGFAPPARREAQSVRIDVGGHGYRASGERTLFPGWMRFYGRYSRSREEDLPTLFEGQKLQIKNVKCEEKFGQRPERFNQSSLLQRMESEKIGTKATRADAIATLVDRGYVAGDQLEVTDLGLTLIEALQEHASPLTSTALTREIESRLEEVEATGTGEAELLRETVRSIVQQLNSLNAAEDRLRMLIGTATSSGEGGLATLGQCPVCKTGRLRVVRSRKSGKRFVGCSNYGANCRASAPLPQRGSIKPTDRPCPHCGWPVILVPRRRAPWKLCVNMNCPGRAGEKR